MFRERVKAWLYKHEPVVSRKSHLFGAALLWTGVGSFLMGRGIYMLAIERQWFLLGGAAFLGGVKALLVLDRTARENVARICQLPDRSCIGGLYSWKTWGLVIIMIVFGRVLRGSGLPRAIVGSIYSAIGCGIFLSSRIVWRQWRRLSQ